MNETALVAASPNVLSQLQAVRSVLAPDLNDAELQLFAMVASRSGLDPFAKQIYGIKRKGRLTFQTGIDGLRSIAARTGEYDGQDLPEFGPDCAVFPACASKKHPEYVTVNVYRKGVSRPIGARAYWHEYIPGEGQDFQWWKMPHVMLGKVAEALALRKAFPWDPNSETGIGGDLYTSEEMAQADTAPPASLAARMADKAVATEILTFSSEWISEAARDLFPDVASLKGLSPEQRVQLRDALVSRVSGGSGSDVQSEGEGASQSILEAPVASVAPICGSVSPFAADEGSDEADRTVCMLAPGHKGAHGSVEAGETWPQGK